MKNAQKFFLVEIQCKYRNKYRMFCALLVFFVCLGISTTVRAYVSTPEEDCQLSNAAICELNGIQYHQLLEACPPQAKTIRPLGNKDCHHIDSSVSNGNLPAEIKHVDTVPSPKIKMQTPNDMARYAPIEKRIIPVIVIGGSVLLAILFIVVLVYFYRTPRETKRAIVSFITKFIIALCAAVIGGKEVLSYVFEKIFDQYNHDTIAPLFLAGPPALIAAAATFFSIFAGIFLLLSQLEKYCGINTGSET